MVSVRLIAFPKGVTQRFSLVCDPALWNGLGDPWIGELRTEYPEIAFEIWTSLSRDAEDWLASGVSDAALLITPVIGPEIESRIFAEEKLVQVSTLKRKAVKWDPDYVYVDHGPGFRNWHAECWPGDETATMTFSNPDWAKAHILARGGSAYLPARMVEGEIAEGRLFTVEGSPSYDRATYLSWRRASAQLFPWLGRGD